MLTAVEQNRHISTKIIINFEISYLWNGLYKRQFLGVLKTSLRGLQLLSQGKNQDPFKKLVAFKIS